MDTRNELFGIDVAAFNVATNSEILVEMLVELLGEANLPAEKCNRVLAVADAVLVGATRVSDRLDMQMLAAARAA